MRYLLLTLLGLFLVSGAVFAADPADGDLDGGDTVSVVGDTTESWDLNHDFVNHWFYKCEAAPYHGFGSYWGDGCNVYEAKREALEKCARSTHQHCYIKYCKKFPKFH